MQEQALAIRGVFLLKFRSVFASAVHVAVDEVVDHLNVIANIELAQGALLQVLRDGGDSIALLDGETGNGKVGAVAVSYTHLRAHETPEHLVCRLLLEK